MERGRRLLEQCGVVLAAAGLHASAPVAGTAFCTTEPSGTTTVPGSAVVITGDQFHAIWLRCSVISRMAVAPEINCFGNELATG